MPNQTTHILRRRPNLVIAMIDASESMGWEVIGGTSQLDDEGRTPIQALRERLPELFTAIRARPEFAHGEIAIGLFRGNEGPRAVRWIDPRTGTLSSSRLRVPMDEVPEAPLLPAIVAEGGTPIASALREIVDIHMEYQEEYRHLPKDSCASAVVFADGHHNDIDSAEPELTEEIERLAKRAFVDQPAMILTVLGTRDADEELLRRIGQHQSYFAFERADMKHLIRTIVAATVSATVNGNRRESIEVVYDRIRQGMTEDLQR